LSTNNNIYIRERESRNRFRNSDTSFFFGFFGQKMEKNDTKSANPFHHKGIIKLNSNVLINNSSDSSITSGNQRVSSVVALSRLNINYINVLNSKEGAAAVNSANANSSIYICTIILFILLLISNN
jgi:hypothetical protein